MEDHPPYISMKIKKIPKNTIIYNEKIYYIHPIYTNYGASKSGKVIHCNILKPFVGSKNHTGYLQVAVSSKNNKQKTFQVHRFVYECFNGLIPKDMVIDHVNDIKDDNRIKNLQMMTQQDNCRKSANKRDYSFAANNHKNRKCVKATNCETNEISYYHSTCKAGKELGINPGIIKMSAEGLNMCKTGISKINKKKIPF